MRRGTTKATRGAVTKEHARNAASSKSERPRRTNGVGAKRAARVEPRGPANDRSNTDPPAEARCLRGDKGACRPADSVPERSNCRTGCLGLSNHRQDYHDEHQRRFWRKPLKDHRTRKWPALRRILPRLIIPHQAEGFVGIGFSRPAPISCLSP